MQITPEGNSTWAVPADFAEPTVEVIVTVSDSSDKRFFHIPAGGSWREGHDRAEGSACRAAAEEGRPRRPTRRFSFAPKNEVVTIKLPKRS